MTMKALYAAAAFAMICAPAAAVPLTFTTFQQKANQFDGRYEDVAQERFALDPRLQASS
jgi:hypothetical protein